MLSPEGLVGKIDAPIKRYIHRYLAYRRKNAKCRQKVEGTPEAGIISGLRDTAEESPSLLLRCVLK